MNDTVIAPSAPLSTQLEGDVARTSVGGGTPKTLSEPVAPESKPEKVESVRDSLEIEAKKINDEDAKAERAEKPENDVKPESDVKETKEVKAKVEAEPKLEKSADAEKPDATAQVEKDQAREGKSETRDRPEPPARFLPKAKEMWYATPATVKSEINRMTQEHEQEIGQYRESHKFREELREYEELGKQHGTTVKQALDNYVNIEKAFKNEPADGFKQLLTNLQMQPRDAIASILKAFNVTPAQLAQHITAAPHEYTRIASAQTPQQPQQPRQDPEIQSLKAKIEAMEHQSLADKIIVPFMNEHPRYNELEGDIAFFLNSGKIPLSLSPADRLEAAYDMAARINPSPHVDQVSSQDDSRDNKPLSRVDPDDFNGKKSVKSAPGNVLDNPEPERKMSTREMLEDELKKLKRA